VQTFLISPFYCIKEIEVVIPMDIEKAPSSCAKETLESKVIGVFFNPWVAEFTTIIITIHFVMLPFDEISGVDYVP
jgi:hypothetical protein